MSRREIVLMVSRAIALLLVIPSVFGLLLTIPTQLMTAYVRQSIPQPLLAQAPFTILRMQGPVLAASLLVFLLHLGVAAIFWNCGPRIECMLLPSGSGTETSD
jgi:hypothetical protein